MRSRRALAVAALAGALAGPGPAAAQADRVGARLSLEAAWQGLTQSGSVSELRVTLASEHAATAQLSLPGQEPPLHMHLPLEPGQAQTLRLPVRPGAGRSVTVRLQMPDASTGEQRFAFREHPPATRLLAVAAPTAREPDSPPPAEMLIFRPATADLPHVAAAYASIDGLVVDQRLLETLAPAQLEALSSYLGDCGRLVTVDLGTQWRERLRSAAGCDGRFSVAAGNDQWLPAAHRLLQRSPPSRPAPATLLPLLDEQSATGQRIVVFFLVYALVLLLFARSGRTLAVLSAAPLAAALALLLWSGTRYEYQQVIWAETYSGSEVSRYTQVVDIRGAGTGSATAPLADLLTPVSTLSGGSAARVVLDQRSGHGARLDLDVKLLSRHLFVREGVRGGDSPVTLRQGPTGPVVSNPQGVASPAGLLAWRGQRYRLPALAPGESWQPPEEAEAWRMDDPLERLLRTRTGHASAAVLLPESRAGREGASPARENREWLLIHAG